jgi:predicted acylesterase/phospholipase RssA
MSSFRLGINMAGAVSAGSYTAGVLDFLIEALDEWYAAKDRGDLVPRHDLSLDVFSGASAGGMCAAIAAALVQGEFDHIHDTSQLNTSNRFYETWVNRIDIRELLQTRDLHQREAVYSLLDCTIIDEIASYSLVPGSPKQRRYISPSLTLFLTLTNLIGIPYSLNDVGDGSLEESTLYHADRLRFETVQPGQPTSTPIAKPLPLGRINEGAWSLLQEAAKATGAFPIFLAPRQLKRDVADYANPMWESINTAVATEPQVTPDWPRNIGTSLNTINVDGGVIDNDPFDLAHDYLASLYPPCTNNQNPREPLKAERAVVTVAPFPAESVFLSSPTLAQDATVASALSRLLSVFITQSRFFGESLALITTGTSSRFVIAPSDTSLSSGTPALQCASLGAFGGFLERSFRAHDFQLGRRNCQQFLRYHFALPAKNPIIEAGLSALGAVSGQALARFKLKAPQDATSELNSDWIPVVPLCSDLVSTDVPEPVRGTISIDNLDEIVGLIDARLGAVLPLLLRDVPSEPLRLCLQGVAKLIELFGRSKIREYLVSQLGDSVQGI